MNYNEPPTIVLKKKLTKSEHNQKYGEAVRKTTTTSNAQTHRDQSSFRIEQEDYKPTLISPAMAQQIIQARVAKGWNQDQLARNSQLTLPVIKEYEKPTSTTVFNNQNVQKISKALGVQIKKT